MKDKRPTLVTIGENAKRNIVQNVRGYGDFDAIKIEGNAEDNSIFDVSVTSVKALTAIEEIKRETRKLEVDEAIKEEIIQRLEELERSKNPQEKDSIYRKLMSSLADHTTVLTPILPALAKLASLFNS
ncbi:hypothetical protein [Serratia nevei]|uniref:hypothetical protein n=1 Tax=Serratia nevei TaxID=2703794 RepID=UPI003FA78BDA